MLPWSTAQADEKRFRIIVTIALVVALLFSIAMPLIKLAERPRVEVERIPPRLAKMLLEKKKVEPPKVEKPKPPEPEKPKVEEKKPEPVKPPEAKPKPKPKPKPKENIEAARKKAASSGVLAMRDMLADLREAQPLEAIKSPAKKLQTGGTTESAKSESVLVARAGRGSGGIDTSNFSRNDSDNELSGREVTTVTSDIETMEKPAEVTQPQEKHKRSQDEILKTMSANYTGFWSLYQRELRRNPLLGGKVVFSITVEPDGKVSKCTILESELGNKKLEHKLVLRIKSINFGAKDVETTTVNVPLNFLAAN
jgi:protein TonB